VHAGGEGGDRNMPNTEALINHIIHDLKVCMHPVIITPAVERILIRVLQRQLTQEVRMALCREACAEEVEHMTFAWDPNEPSDDIVTRFRYAASAEIRRGIES
jgi:hypothetical protein